MASNQAIKPGLLLTQWCWREVRSGQLWIVALALMLIFASVFALTALSSRLEQVIVKQGKDALTADLVFESSNPITDVVREQIIPQPELVTTELTRFATMSFSDSQMQLISVNAVSSDYPLQGSLTLERDGQRFERVQPGELWLDDRLFSLLDINTGDVLSVGDAELTVTGRIAEFPGLSFNPFQQMPAALIHHSSIEQTGAIQPGSRVRYKLFIDGPSAQLEQLQEQIELTPSDRWRTTESGSRTNDVFANTQQFLSLTVVVVILMAATTLVLTCQHYVSTRERLVSMLKSMGATRVWLQRWLATQLLMLATIAVVTGTVLGMLLEYGLRFALIDLLPAPLPSYGITPFATALLSCALISVPAVGIPLLRLLNAKASQVISVTEQHANYRHLGLVLVPLVPFLLLYASNKLVWLILFGLIGLVIALGLISVGLVSSAQNVSSQPAYQLALSRINRNKLATGLQFGCLAFSVMLLAILWLVRTDLLADWQRTIPENAPNAFALNIAEYEKQAYIDTLDSAQIDRSEAFPIIRGRLSLINQQPAKEQQKSGADTDAVRRELNFTWAEQLPDYNEVLEGQWTSNGGVSVEKEVADALNIQLGDILEFVVNSQPFTAQVNSIRAVEWRDMKPNFYFIFTPDVMASIPTTYLVSFRLQEQHDDLFIQLSREHPTVSLMDIRIMGEKIQQLVKQIVSAITLLAGLAALAGLLLIYTLLNLSLAERQSEMQLYRTLGASERRLRKTLWIEYGVIAIVASLVATAGAELVVASVMTFGFELSAQAHLWVWILLPLLTMMTLALVVQGGMRRILVPLTKG
ncbi:ABC transporter permease [Vibrio sp. WXL103]|uniref:ABC transporter permease n=1 Tax=Vibrio sp. WXL103 TaxID=3450710 RepID=UPI003EC55604